MELKTKPRWGLIGGRSELGHHSGPYVRKIELVDFIITRIWKEGREPRPDTGSTYTDKLKLVLFTVWHDLHQQAWSSEEDDSRLEIGGGRPAGYEARGLGGPRQRCCSYQ